MNVYDPPFPRGVPNPYHPFVHPYPTRYHGPIYTQPDYTLPFQPRPYGFPWPLINDEPFVPPMPATEVAGLGATQWPDFPPGVATDPDIADKCRSLHPDDTQAAYNARMQCYYVQSNEKANTRRDLMLAIPAVLVAGLVGYFIGRKR